MSQTAEGGAGSPDQGAAPVPRRHPAGHQFRETDAKAAVMARQGGWSGGSQEPLSFWERTYDPQTRSLRLEHRGRIWDAVAAGRHTSDGAGRVVAVVDSGFDPEIIALDPIHPASRLRSDTIGPTGRHGTVVAALIREVAPAAELLLIDAGSPSGPTPASIASGIAYAVEQDADIVNLSVEWTTDAATRDTSWIRPEAVDTITPQADSFLDQVDQWLAHTEPYAGARCQQTCPLCDALLAAPETMLVVAAAGNRFPATCPACVTSAVGVGFTRVVQVDRDGREVTIYLPPESSGSVLLPEVVVDEPPGFRGSSFAAPLLSGLAALTAEPTDLRGMSGLAFALTPILTLAQRLAAADPDEVSDDVPGILHQGLVRIAEAVPPAHRHWEAAQVTQPCPLCALVLTDWYDVFTSLLVGTGAPCRGLAIGRIAAVIAPEAASVQGNLGLAAARCAEQAPSAQERGALLELARAAYTRAAARAPDVELYAGALAGLPQA